MAIKLVLSLVFVSLFLSNVFAETSYPILCKGGKDLNFRLVPKVSGSLLYYELWVTFKRSALAAGQTGTPLKNSECSWVDRPINPNTEPNTLVFISTSDVFAIEWKGSNTYAATGSGLYDVPLSTFIFQYKDASQDPFQNNPHKSFPKFVGGTVYSFMAYNNRSGGFTVTK